MSAKRSFKAAEGVIVKVYEKSFSINGRIIYMNGPEFDQQIREMIQELLHLGFKQRMKRFLRRVA